MRSLPEFAITRPVTTIIGTVTALLLGCVAVKRIPLEFIPELSRPHMTAVVPYPNATPQEVERQVVEPLEDDLRIVAGLENLHATAGRDSARLNLQFAWGTNMRVAYLDVRERLEALRRTLPPEARNYFIWKGQSSDFPVIMAVLAWPGATDELFRITDDRIKPALERLPGVAVVDAWGASQPIVQIDLDQQRMQAHGIDPYRLLQSLRRYHVSLSTGAVRAGDRQYVVRVVDTYETPEQIANIRVSAEDVRLRDVATVRYGYPEREFIGRMNGENAVSVAVRKESQANTVATCQAVVDALTALEAEPDLKGLGHFIFFNQGAEIRKAAVGLSKAGLWGAGLAVVMLLAFLRRWRMTLLVSLAIPVSILLAVASLYVLGRSLNIITMLGLMIAVGALVDNSVVVVENIVRLRQDGVGPRAAAERGATEVGLALLASTATTVVVFLPLVFLESGEIRVYMRELGLALGLSLAASLLVAFTVVPLAARRLLTGAAPGQTRFGRRGADAYRRLLRRVLRHPWLTVGATAALVAVTALVPGRRVSTSGRPHSTGRQARIDLHPGFPTSNLPRTEALFAQVEDILEAHRDDLEIDTIFSFSGRGNDSLRVFVSFLEPPASTTPVQELVDRLTDALPARLPDADLRVGHIDEESDERSFALSLRGDDGPTLVRLADELSRRLLARPGVRKVEHGEGRDASEVQVRVDPERALRAGLNSQTVAATLAFALRGTQLPSLHTPRGEVEVWAQLEPEDRRDEGTLADLRLATATGDAVSLGSVARFVPAPGPREIVRDNGKRVYTLQVTTSGLPMSEARKAIRAAMADMVLPAGYELTFGSKFDAFLENQRSWRLALALAVVLIYLVLGSLFESWVSPVLILTSVPLALVGTYWVMYATGSTLDIAAMVGLILLIGVVANNAIVIVDRINQMRWEGAPLTEAVVEGGVQRLRPVLMTAFTTILGLVPLAVGNAGLFGGEIMFAPVGRAIIGGLLTSTVLVLVIVPFGYVLLARAEAWVGWVFGRRGLPLGRL